MDIRPEHLNIFECIYIVYGIKRVSGVRMCKFD